MGAVGTVAAVGAVGVVAPVAAVGAVGAVGAVAAVAAVAAAMKDSCVPEHARITYMKLLTGRLSRAEVERLGRGKDWRNQRANQENGVDEIKPSGDDLLLAPRHSA